MRRLATLAGLLVLAPALIAAGHGEEADLLEPCTNTDGKIVVTMDGASGTVDAPAIPAYGSSESVMAVLDLAGLPVEDDTATVDVTLTWEVMVNDYDLYLYDASGGDIGNSQEINPAGEASESFGASFAHCDVFEVEVRNWAAVAYEAELDLSFTAFQFNF